MADEEWGDALGDALKQMVRSVARRGRREVKRAANAGRHRLELRQKQKDLDHFWARLGKTAHHLVLAGEIEHPALRKAMDRIEALERELDKAGLAPSAGPE